jgi:hypothetical protein
MVARIKTPSAITRALNYNEQKVKQGHAVLLHAANYLKGADKLNFKEKLKRFQDLIMLNEGAKTNSLHISLNFDNADKFSAEKLIEIGNSYMNKIGFTGQPYLVYQHNDAGHPHIHIVTTTIKENGKRIDTFNIGRNQSEKARKEIEQEFNLIKAGNKQSFNYNLKPVSPQRIQYGKAETKQAITNVLDHVLPTYKYASLAELNAVLQQYNVVADRGKENSRIYNSNGLVYRILDGKGQKIGVPIKASLIYNQPTLKNITAQFENNDKERQTHKRRVISAIDFALLKQSNKSLKELMSALQKEKIQVVLRQNDRGFIYGITYVDFQTKCVFNGSTLGKEYSANAIQQRCNAEKPTQVEKPRFSNSPFEHDKIESQSPSAGFTKIFDELIQPEENRFANEPPEQRKFKKRKRRQKHSHN